MRILKKRIAEAKRLLLQRPKFPKTRSSTLVKYRDQSESETSSSSSLIKKAIKKISPNPDPDDRMVEKSLSDFSIKSTKNIVKNYARAICNFISMEVAQEYLEDLRDKLGCESIEEFKSFVFANKESVDCIQRFKSMLLTNKHDCEKLCTFKKMFQMIGEIFIKFFSVNWIYGGRLKHKKAHLAFRFKMLRRLKKPQLFTHLKSFNKKI